MYRLFIITFLLDHLLNSVLCHIRKNAHKGECVEMIILSYCTGFYLLDHTFIFLPLQKASVDLLKNLIATDRKICCFSVASVYAILFIMIVKLNSNHFLNKKLSGKFPWRFKLKAYYCFFETTIGFKRVIAHCIETILCN